MKRFLICLFSFLFIGCSIAGGAVLLSNSSYSDEYRGGDSSNSENDVTKNAPTNDDLWTDEGNYATSFAGGDGQTEATAYQIATPEQLAYLSYLINTSSTNSTYKSLYYVQTADIDLSAHYWDAIGYSFSYYFSGHYDGGGYTISGLYTQSGTSSTYSDQGLFGGVRGSSSSNLAVIQNIVISYNSVVQGYSNVGGVVGYAYYSTITNCYNTGTVSGTDAVGGVVGIAQRSTITNCYNTGSVKGNENVGGVVGDARYFSSAITNCYNTGTVTGSGNAVGGVAGSVFSTYLYTTANCYNTGSVTGSKRVGGVVGDSSCSGSSTIANCYNTGAVDGDSHIGGVVGYVYNSTTANCYYGGNCTLSYGIGNSSSNTGASKDENLIANAKSLSWYQDSSKWRSRYPWDFVEVWSLVPSANDGYPILQGFSVNISYNSNFGENEVITEQVPSGQEIVIAGYDLFTRVGYEIAHWNTKPDGTGLNFYAGDTYSEGAGLTLYAIWEAGIYSITLDANGGSDGTETIWLKYNDGYYNNSSATGSAITSLTSLPTRAGYSFNGYYTNSTTGNLIIASDGTIRANNTYFTANTTLYAQWTANNPAYYDEEGGYWYIENGRAPQSRVEDETLKTYLEENWDNLNAGTTYHFGGWENITTKVYNGEEYMELYGNYYLVEPIRWRIISNGNQEVGYGEVSEDGIMAVMDKIIYLGRYAGIEISAGEGYSDMPISYLLNSEHPLISDKFLVEWTESLPTFGTTSIHGETIEYTSKAFVSSIEDIEAVTGDRKVKFSDYVEDLMVIHKGVIPLCYTRDLGSNYNNILCLNENGDITQRKPNLTVNQLGVQFTIKISEYACVSSL